MPNNLQDIENVIKDLKRLSPGDRQAIEKQLSATERTQIKKIIHADLSQDSNSEIPIKVDELWDLTPYSPWLTKRLSALNEMFSDNEKSAATLATLDILPEIIVGTNQTIISGLGKLKDEKRTVFSSLANIFGNGSS